MFYVYSCATHGRFYRKIDDKVCPKCNTDATFVSQNKHRPTNAWEAVGLAFNRLKRKFEEKDDEKEEDFLKWEDSDEEEIDEEDDDEYLLPKNYNPDMRYTKGTRSYKPDLNLKLTKSKSWTRVGNSGTRLDATKIMGCSARETAGRGESHKKNPHKGCEWCHLIADSLGGATTMDNLVASSYAANTAMCVIEKAIEDYKNKFIFEICVEAYGTKDHVADWILYKIRVCGGSNSGKKKVKREAGMLEFKIDGKNDEFSKEDATAFRDTFTNWLKAPWTSLSFQ
jgi:hypothetical protein